MDKCLIPVVGFGKYKRKQKKLSKIIRILSKRHEVNLKRLPTGQKWGSSNLKMNDDYNELKHIKYIKIYDLVMIGQKKLIGYLWQLLGYQHIMLKIGRGVEKNQACFFSLSFTNHFWGQFLRVLEVGFSFSRIPANKFRKTCWKLEKWQICNLKWINRSRQELLLAVKTSRWKVAGKFYSISKRSEPTDQV